MNKSSEIVRRALVEPSADDLPEGVVMTDGGDGTVTFRFTIEVDPEVASEKGVAMPKGQRREDMSDVVDPDESPVAEDAAPSQGGKSIHDTPLENCRAVDPMFCPYHGAKAIERAIETHFQTYNKNAIPSLKVSVSRKSRGAYSVQITTASTDTSTAVASILDLAKVNGFRIDKSGAAQSLVNNGDGTHTYTDEVDTSASGNRPSETDSRTALLNEWTDTLLDDYANNPNTKVESDDLADMLQAQQEIDDVLAHPTGKKTADMKAFRDKCREFEMRYHAIRAQDEMAHVVTPSDASAELARITATKSKDSWTDVSKVMNDACAKLGIPKGTLARKFPWSGRDVYNARSSRAYASSLDLDRLVKNDFGSAMKSNDMKALRTALHNISYAVTEYNDSMKAFRESLDSQMKEAGKLAAQRGITL